MKNAMKLSIMLALMVMITTQAQAYTVSSVDDGTGNGTVNVTVSGSTLPDCSFIETVGSDNVYQSGSNFPITGQHEIVGSSYRIMQMGANLSTLTDETVTVPPPGTTNKQGFEPAASGATSIAGLTDSFASDVKGKMFVVFASAFSIVALMFGVTMLKRWVMYQVDLQDSIRVMEDDIRFRMEDRGEW